MTTKKFKASDVFLVSSYDLGNWFDNRADYVVVAKKKKDAEKKNGK